jgi:ubiquinone/menaquinone biosynthesis C-methylase UbiE
VRLDDPEVVRAEYASERRLASRKAAFRFAVGPDAREVTFDAIAESANARYLEVGCGEGELAERVQRELGSEVVALDQSERMVALTRARGVDARVGDVQALPFENEEFDCAVAAWMLYHVPDVDQALGELARVLRPQGRLVAVTNAREHLRELAAALGTERHQLGFDGENAEELLGRHFGRVERREAYGWLTFPSRSEAQAYVDSTIVYAGRRLGEFDGPLRARKAPVVFVAHKQ